HRPAGRIVREGRRHRAEVRRTGHQRRGAAAWGRTGVHMFGISHWNVTPDVLTSAKGMGNGTPIGLTIATPEVADKYPGVTFATFGGNAVSCAAAHATINYIEDNNLVKNCAVIGKHLGERFAQLK